MTVGTQTIANAPAALDKLGVTVATPVSTPMVKVPLVSDCVIQPSQDSLQPVRKELVADLCKIIEQQSKEIANLRDSAAIKDTLPPSLADVEKPHVPAAAALITMPEETLVRHMPPLAHSEIARTHTEDGDQSETISTDDELPPMAEHITGRKRPPPATNLDVLTAAANKFDTMTNEKPTPSNLMSLKEEPAKRRCITCGTTQTPKWRCGMTLCNACGLRNIKRQTTSRNVSQQRRSAAEQAMRPIVPLDSLSNLYRSGADARSMGGSPMMAHDMSSTAMHRQVATVVNNRDHNANAVSAQVVMPTMNNRHADDVPQRNMQMDQTSGVVQAQTAFPVDGAAPRLMSQAMPSRQPSVGGGPAPSHQMIGNNVQDLPQGPVQAPMSNGMNQSMMSNGMSMMNNGMNQPILNGMGQHMLNNSMGMMNNGMGQPMMNSGMGQLMMNSSMGQQMLSNGMNQPMMSNGMSQPMLSNVPRQPMVSNAPTQQPMMSNASSQQQMINNAPRQSMVNTQPIINNGSAPQQTVQRFSYPIESSRPAGLVQSSPPTQGQALSPATSCPPIAAAPMTSLPQPNVPASVKPTGNAFSNLQPTNSCGPIAVPNTFNSFMPSCNTVTFGQCM
mmetsp:Transcript_25430/g.54945  ORF Transcript_25430/g.54945 Transcript_25430/m.54945 type:complete len:616 (-) Transcript_25430:477-2324(-)